PLSGVRSNQLSYRPINSRWSACYRSATDLLLCAASCFRDPRLRLSLFFGTESQLDQAMRVSTYETGEASIKEVIQPQVPLRLPCYDFTPVMNHTVVTVLRG